jgi:hypothetical protein
LAQFASVVLVAAAFVVLTGLLGDAQMVVAHGYGALLFDFRNSGESDGDLTTLGLLEANDKEIFVVEGAGHGGFRTAAPEQYERRIIGFLNDHLLGR